MKLAVLHTYFKRISIVTALVFVLSAGVVYAQTWLEPTDSPPGDVGDPNVGPVLYSGSRLNTDVGCPTGGTIICGGGETQYRVGSLRIGDESTGTHDVEIAGSQAVTGRVIGGLSALPGSVTAAVEGYAGALYNSHIYGVYGESLTGATFAGVYGTMTAGGGSAVMADSGTAQTANAVFGSAEGIDGRAVYGRNANSDLNAYATYFVGRVNINGANGTLDVDGDVTSDDSVSIANALSVPSGTVIIGGKDLQQLNAISLQNQSLATPYQPSDIGTIKMFSLTENNLENGDVKNWTTPLTQDDFLVQANVYYRDSDDTQAKWYPYRPAVPINSVLRQCSRLSAYTLAQISAVDFIYQLIEDDNNYLYISTDPNGDVMRSTDGGITWTNTANLPNAQNIWALEKAADGSIIAGTGGAATDDIYRSTDQGASWTGQTLAGVTYIRTIFRAANGHLFAGTEGAGDIFRSTNNGVSWTPMGDLAGVTLVWSITQDSAGNLYAGTSANDGVFKSTDGGLTWSPTTGTFPVAASEVFSLAADSVGNVYAGTYPNGDVFKTTNGGTTWVATPNLNFSGYNARDIFSLFVDSRDALYVGANAFTGGGFIGAIFKSTDNATTWSPSVSFGLVSAPVTYDIMEDHRNVILGAGVRAVPVSDNQGNVFAISTPTFSTDSTGIYTLKNTTGSRADFRIVGSYIRSSTNQCP